MTEITNVQVLGLRHLRDVMLKSIPVKAHERVVIAAIRKAFKPMVAAAKINAVKTSGALAGSIQLWKVSKRKKAKQKKTFASAEIGPRRSNKKAMARYVLEYGVTALTPEQVTLGLRYGHLVEYGIPSRQIAAQPFLRPAFDSHALEGVNNFAKEWGKAIEREAIRLARIQNKKAK